MSRITDIITGATNHVLNKEEMLFKERFEKCRVCPLLSLVNMGKNVYVCNRHKYVDPITNDVSDRPKTGYKSGCGCVLTFKLRVRNQKCPLNRW